MPKILAILLVAVGVILMAGCGGDTGNTPAPETIRVESPIPYSYTGYAQGADLVGSQTWRVYGDRPDRPVELVPVENDAITITRGVYMGAYTEWSLTALSSWRTDLKVMVNGETINTIFVLTEHVWPEKLHISVAGAEQLSDVEFDTGLLDLGTSKDVTVSWVHDNSYPGYPNVPVLWSVPVGLRIEVLEPGAKKIRVTIIKDGSFTLTGDVAGKIFHVKLTVPRA